MCSVLAVTTGLSALGGFAQYKQQEAAIENQAAMYKAQAAAAEQNAKVEGKRQEQIADKYGEEQRRLRARQRLAEGQLRAQAGAAGIDSTTGSPFDIQAAGQEAYENDKLTLLGNQRNDNYASRVQQSNYLNEAASSRAAASNLESQLGPLKWGTILGTAASIAGNFGGGGSAAGGTSASGSLYASSPTSISSNILGWANAKPTITSGMRIGQKGLFG